MSSDQAEGFAQLRERLSRTENGFSTEISDHWRQGRTTYGGITAGLALAAAHKSIADLPPLRSMLVNFTGPVVANPTFTPACLRQGKSVTTVQVTVRSDDDVAAQIILSFGGNRDSRLSVPGVAKPLEHPPLEYEPFTPKEFESFVPQFVTNFDTRLVSGHRSVAGAEEGYVHAVSRHIDPNSRIGTESLVTLADVLPPAALCMAKTMAPVSSVTWMMNMLTDNPETEAGWWQVAARLTAADNGYSNQQMSIWALDGTPIAEGMQCVAQFF